MRGRSRPPAVGRPRRGPTFPTGHSHRESDPPLFRVVLLVERRLAVEKALDVPRQQEPDLFAGGGEEEAEPRLGHAAAGVFAVARFRGVDEVRRAEQLRDVEGRRSSAFLFFPPFSRRGARNPRRRAEKASLAPVSVRSNASHRPFRERVEGVARGDERREGRARARRRVPLPVRPEVRLVQRAQASREARGELSAVGASPATSPRRDAAPSPPVVETTSTRRRRMSPTHARCVSGLGADPRVEIRDGHPVVDVQQTSDVVLRQAGGARGGPRGTPRASGTAGPSAPRARTGNFSRAPP